MKQSDGFSKLHWTFTIPIPMGRTVSYGCIIIQIYRSWQNDHSTSRSRIIAWIARFFRSWRTISTGSLHIKRIWLLYSVVKEHLTVFASLWKSTIGIMDFHRLTSGAEERGMLRPSEWLNYDNLKVSNHIHDSSLYSAFQFRIHHHVDITEFIIQFA